jgi:hypothetical protein
VQINDLQVNSSKQRGYLQILELKEKPVAFATGFLLIVLFYRFERGNYADFGEIFLVL